MGFPIQYTNDVSCHFLVSLQPGRSIRQQSTGRDICLLAIYRGYSVVRCGSNDPVLTVRERGIILYNNDFEIPLTDQFERLLDLNIVPSGKELSIQTNFAGRRNNVIPPFHDGRIIRIDHSCQARCVRHKLTSEFYLFADENITKKSEACCVSLWPIQTSASPRRMGSPPIENTMGISPAAFLAASAAAFA